MERMSAEGLFFHRGCLKCDYCDGGLRLNNYSADRLPNGDGMFNDKEGLSMLTSLRHFMPKQNDHKSIYKLY